jgi:uncharacterized protein (DUF58 family)
MPLFDSTFLKKLEYLSLVARRTFRGQLLAHRRGKQLGAGTEFADHRDYAPGDDFRYLDWNMYARHGDLLLKRFHQEEDLHVYLFLDCSRSMRFGQPAKFDFARQIAAALVYIALADGDRVSVVPFSGDMLEVFPLTRGKARILSVFEFLDQLQTVGADTDLTRVVNTFVHRHPRAGLAVLISDLFAPAGFQRGLDLLRHHRFEPSLVHLYDRHDQSPELRGDLQLRDLETEFGKQVTVSPRSLQRYREVFEQFLDSVTSYARSYGLACVQTSTDVSLEALVLHMMRQAAVLG